MSVTADMSVLFGDICGVVVTVSLIVVSLLFWGILQYSRVEAAAQRKGSTRDDFVNYFRAKDVPQEISAGVYDGLPKYQMILRHFPVHPDDNLESVYGVGGEGGTPFCEFIDEIAPDCGVRTPTATQLSVRIKECSPITTVADLVRLLSRLRDE